MNKFGLHMFMVCWSLYCTQQ